MEVLINHSPERAHRVTAEVEFDPVELAVIRERRLHSHRIFFVVTEEETEEYTEGGYFITVGDFLEGPVSLRFDSFSEAAAHEAGLRKELEALKKLLDAGEESSKVFEL